MNMAIKDSIGGWKDNAHLLKSPKACSTVKSILGTEWPLYLKSFGINNFNCPIAPVIILNFSKALNLVIKLLIFHF